MAPLVETGLSSVLPGLAGIAHPADVLDMPVDPNEPTYCLCHQVSYGEMIGCDNLDVSLHLQHYNVKFFNATTKFLLLFFSAPLSGSTLPV